MDHRRAGAVTQQAGQQGLQARPEGASEPGLAKTYRALTHGSVPLGPMAHHMYDGPFSAGAPVLGGGTLRPRGLRLLSGTAHAGWTVCELVVGECKVGGVVWVRAWCGLGKGVMRYAGVEGV